MPRPAEWAEHEVEKLRKENDKLRNEIDQLKTEHAEFAYETGKRHGEQMKLDDEIMDANRELREKLMDANREWRETILELRAGGALVVHALDCAIAFNEQLFVFLPQGTVMPQAIVACQHQFSEAMRAIGHTRQTWPLNPGNTPATSTIPSTETLSSSTSLEPTAGSLSPSPATSPSSSESETLVRANRALAIAGYNIAELQEAGAALTATLNQALLLVDRLIEEMRRAGTVPSGLAVVAKARLDQEMRKVLALKERGGMQ
jgi:hypothetical protein